MKKKIFEIFENKNVVSFLIVLIFLGLTGSIYNGVFNNYLHEILDISKSQRGMVELFRELPGLLLVIIFAFLYRFQEISLVKFAILLSIAGLVGLVFSGPNKIIGISLIVLWSSGEHIIMPLKNSIAIHMSKKGKEGLAMGSVRGFFNIGRVVGFFLAPVIFFITGKIFNKSIAISYKTAFLLSAILMAMALYFSRKLSDDKERAPRQRLYFNKKYIKYYILEIFFGARKQVFITFAPYVLIVKYGAKTELISTLYGIWALLNIFFSPIVGKLIDSLGYKKVIIVDSILLIILCFLYGFTHRVLDQNIAFIVVSVVFVIDAMLFAVGIARPMYVKDISSSKEEITSTLSTGLSINHLISIIIAFFGGIIWQHAGIELLFSIAALFGFLSFLFSLTLPKKFIA